MVIEREIPEFWRFLLPGLLVWLITFGIVVAIGLFLSLLFAMVNHGFAAGASAFGARLRGTLVDLVCVSPRRVWAMSSLAFVEAIRRRVWIVLVVYLLILLFAGWFLPADVDDPARLYIDFVMSWSTLLVMGLAAMLCAFSLPLDIANRTIFTVMTKPVRSTEVLLGRIIGFMAVCTLLLAIMAAVGWVFVKRSLVHTHTMAPEALAEGTERDARGATTKVLRGETLTTNKHRHRVTINAETGQGETDVVFGHKHLVERKETEKGIIYEVGEPVDYLTARVPIYAEKLEFRDTEGQISDKGISVGAEWEYRSYIEGGTRAAGIWKFRGLTKADFPEERFPEGLQVDVMLSVFRTHKGDIEKGVAATMILSNPHTRYQAEPMNFITREFGVHTQILPYNLRARRENSSRVEDVDLWNDLISQGELLVEIRCLDSQQYLGMAKPDVYLSAAERSFEWNYIKGYVGIWMQVLIVAAFGVYFSTFLNGFVSLLCTVGIAVGGYLKTFMLDIATGVAPGGGPVESFVRMMTRAPIVTPLEPGTGSTVIQSVDALIFNQLLRVIALAIPDLTQMGVGEYGLCEWVCSGYDIRANDMCVLLCSALGYVVGVVLLGHYVFKGRELAK